MNRILLAIAAIGLLNAGCNFKPVAAPTPPPPTPTAVQNVPAMPTVPPAQQDVERVVAKQGVGIKGRSLDQHEGIIVTPAKSLFAFKERAVFEIQLPHALQLYAATNDGKGPQSHDEFMEHIVTENNIKLPQLPPEHRYVFDVETQQLMVEKPKTAAPAPAPPK